MNNFTEFKNEIGYSSKEFEKITGYTRQGLHNAFNTINQGKKANDRFLVCINAAIDKKIQEEIRIHEEKLKKLRELQEKYLEGGI